MPKAAPNRGMNNPESNPGFKPWLLAFALAAILTWYVVNPVSGQIRRLQKEDEARDGKHRHQAHDGGKSLPFGMLPAIQSELAHTPGETEEELPKWPEYIELG